ncbi:sensor histidine kinase [Phenylobacterium sp.]|jgi:two-component sensor histidine kinase|uniref:sensor histidine kinase n=1 Tax=Phenylobacterium sp. TaxID=1871053 RepID=UPI002F3F8ED9
MASDAAVDPADSTLREVDHRVKNNLQMIASLIQLQCRRTEDETVRAALRTVLGRVGAVATVHRRLFQGDPGLFEAADFLRDLTADMAGQAGRDDIQIALDLEAVTLPAASGAPFALIANELLDNALRHAFPPQHGGRIAVGLAPQGGGCRLTIADDGAGLGGRADGFGLTVVRLLCRQLHAELALEDARPGLRVTLTVPRRDAG